MSSYKTKLLTALAAAGVMAGTAVYTPVSQAFNFGEMMNPGKWMGGNRDYDDEWGDYGPGPYGPPGLGPYGGGPYGGPYGGGPYGGGPYGGPYGGGPGFGTPRFYGAPGYRAAPVAPSAPSTPSRSSSSSENVKSAEIEALRKRIEELETKQQPSYAAPPPGDWGSTSSPSPGSSGWGSAPAFRPMNKY